MNAPVSLIETKGCCEWGHKHALFIQNTHLIHWTHFSHRVQMLLPEENVFIPEKSVLLPEEQVLIPEESVLFKKSECMAALGHHRSPTF